MRRTIPPKNAGKKGKDVITIYHKGGNPGLYQANHPERAFKLCLLGLTDKDLALAFGVSEQTINKWKNWYPEFKEALCRGKTEADGEVVHSLYQAAIGYEHDDVHISSYMGSVKITPIVKRYPPNVKAALAWLRNRQKDLWPPESHQVTGEGGGPVRALLGTVSLDDLPQATLEMALQLGIRVGVKTTDQPDDDEDYHDAEYTVED